jgi:hypothetical protein
MLQRDDDRWSWGRYVLVHPAANTSIARAGARYRELLLDDATFEVRTIESILGQHAFHPPDVEDRFRARYLW